MSYGLRRNHSALAERNASLFFVFKLELSYFNLKSCCAVNPNITLTYYRSKCPKTTINKSVFFSSSILANSTTIEQELFFLFYSITINHRTLRKTFRLRGNMSRPYLSDHLNCCHSRLLPFSNLKRKSLRSILIEIPLYKTNDRARDANLDRTM